MIAKMSEFTRIVLGLHRGLPEDVTVHLAAELAELLRLDLFGLFIADESVLSLAGLPFAREFRPFGGGWQPIDVERISIELELEARRAERRFSRAVRKRRTAASFHVLKASTADAFGSICRAGDIVLIPEAADLSARATRPLSALVEAAGRSASAVLLVPRRVARQRGPVVAITAGPDDPSTDVATMIAVAAKEHLVLIEADNHPRGERLAAAVEGMTTERRSALASRLIEPQYLSSVFEQLTERLVVVTRQAFDDSLPSLLESLRHIPVLALEPRMQAADIPAQASD